MPVKKKRRNRLRRAWQAPGAAWLAQGLMAAGSKAADLESVKRRTRSAANTSQQLRRLDKKRALGRVPEALKLSLKGVDGEAHE